MTGSKYMIGRRNICNFKDTAISHEVLSGIFIIASYAPSWRNSQIVFKSKRIYFSLRFFSGFVLISPNIM